MFVSWSRMTIRQCRLKLKTILLLLFFKISVILTVFRFLANQPASHDSESKMVFHNRRQEPQEILSYVTTRKVLHRKNDAQAYMNNTSFLLNQRVHYDISQSKVFIHHEREDGLSYIATRKMVDPEQNPRIRMMNTTYIPKSDTCIGLLKPKLPIETFDWQIITTGVTYAFSAYYDPRIIPAVVKIFGISSGEDGPSPKYCQVWYANTNNPTVSLAVYDIIPETHDRKFAPSVHTCCLEGNVIPYAVSLVSEKCKKAENILVVKHHSYHAHPKVNFTVCVTPLNFNFDNVYRLLEMIETNRMLGAQKIVFYNYSSGAHIAPYLHSYINDGLVDVLPWRIPVGVDVWPPDPGNTPQVHYFGQVVALNDCLYRYMFLSKYIVFTDLDEFIVPQMPQTMKWSELLQQPLCEMYDNFNPQSGKEPFVSIYIFQNVFFRTDWPDDEAFSEEDTIRQMKIQSLLKTAREKDIYIWGMRSKYITEPSLVELVGIHFLIRPINDELSTQCFVSRKFGLLHHYRIGLSENLKDKLISNVMYAHKNNLLHRIKNAHRRISKHL